MKRTDEWRRKRTTKILQPLAEKLGIWQSYFIYQQFTDKLGGTSADGTDFGSNATATSQAPYRRIYVTWSRAFVDKADDEALRRTALHELMHGFVFDKIGGLIFGMKDKQYRDRYMDLEENAVDLITLWLYQFGGQELGFAP